MIGGARVIAISGHPGGGKTTLTRALADKLGMPAFHYDDYERVTRKKRAEIEEWMARGAPYDEFDLAPMLHAMAERERAERPRIIFMDTLLGRAHAQTGGVIDTLIWLDTPADVALARKLRAASKRAQQTPAEAPQFAAWLDHYLLQYQLFIAQTYVTQVERVRPGADIVLDGRLPPEILVEKALDAVGEADWSARLLAFAMARNAPFGRERSVKFARSGIKDGRFLLSFHKSDLGADPLPLLRDFAAEFRLDAALAASLAGGLEAADFVHFGFEAEREPVLKLYLEFASAMRPANSNPAGPAEPITVHLAAKWQPTRPGSAKLTRYSWNPRQPHLAALLPDLSQPTAQLWRAVLDATAGRCAPSELMALLVDEEGSARRSVDVNLYPAGLRVREIAQPIRQFAGQLGLSPERVDTALQTIVDERLGHVSAGLDRSGQPFATLYFGVKAEGSHV